MTEQQAKDEMYKYIKARERNLNTAVCKKCGDIQFIPMLVKDTEVKNSIDGGKTVKETWTVKLKPCGCTFFKKE